MHQILHPHRIGRWGQLSGSVLPVPPFRLMRMPVLKASLLQPLALLQPLWS